MKIDLGLDIDIVFLIKNGGKAIWFAQNIVNYPIHALARVIRKLHECQACNSAISTTSPLIERFFYCENYSHIRTMFNANMSFGTYISIKFISIFFLQKYIQTFAHVEIL